jgi:hypothetical protein
MKGNLEKISKINAKKAALADIQMALARGEVLHFEDQAIWDEGEPAIQADLNAKREVDRKLRKEKLDIRSMLEKNQTELQKYCLNQLRSTYSYEVSGRFYKIGRGRSSKNNYPNVGAVELTQPMGESLREVGMAFRNLVTDGKKLRSLSYKSALEIVERYEKAVDPHHRDLPSIQDALKAMRENPDMSRYSWCMVVRSLCDETLLADFIRTVDLITTTEAGSQDMGNSLNLATEFNQLLDQGRCRPLIQMKRAKELAQIRNFLNEEVNQQQTQKINSNSGKTKRYIQALMSPLAIDTLEACFDTWRRLEEKSLHRLFVLIDFWILEQIKTVDEVEKKSSTWFAKKGK